MQTSPNLQVRQREHELEERVLAARTEPGLQAMRELAVLRQAAAHAKYLTAGPSPEIHATEKIWYEIVRVIDQGAKVKFDEDRRGVMANG